MTRSIRTRSTRTRALAAAAAGALLLGAASCSLPPDDRVNRIEADDLGELANPTTTTTTTVPQTTLPPVTEPGSPTTTSTTSTTVAALPTLPQRLYYTLGATDDVQVVTLPLAEDANYATLRTELENPRPEVRAQRYATAVRPGLIAGFDFDAEAVTLTISLDGTIFEGMTETQRRRAIGQIVLTYTSFAPRDTGSIGFVRFLVDGAPISVFVPRTGSLSTEGQPLRFVDFRVLLEPGSPTETTSPPTTPPTSPPTSPPATAAPA